MDHIQGKTNWNKAGLLPENDLRFTKYTQCSSGLLLQPFLSISLPFGSTIKDIPKDPTVRIPAKWLLMLCNVVERAEFVFVPAGNKTLAWNITDESVRVHYDHCAGSLVELFDQSQSLALYPQSCYIFPMNYSILWQKHQWKCSGFPKLFKKVPNTTIESD